MYIRVVVETDWMDDHIKQFDPQSLASARQHQQLRWDGRVGRDGWDPSAAEVKGERGELLLSVKFCVADWKTQ